MRASRLVSILLLLQRHQALTAQQLADEVEVTVRTIYRDIDALQLAGIPIYGDAGHGGGYRLVDGFRTRLDGLTRDEAEAFALAGLPGPAAELGLGATIASMTLKFHSALPPELRSSAEEMAKRFLFDPSGWFHDGDQSPFLHVVAQAVWQHRSLWIIYRGWQATVEREVEPYGLVLKGGTWYLVARSSDHQPDHEATELRTYRINQLLNAKTLGRIFTPDSDFDLTDHWSAQVQTFRASLNQGEATIRISPQGRERLRELEMIPWLTAVEAVASSADDDGWVTATVPIESPTHTVSEILRLRAEVEVLSPTELRVTIADVLESLTDLYRSNPN